MEVYRARLLLCSLGVYALRVASGCILPADGQPPPVSLNFPPEIDLTTLDPPAPVFYQNVDEQTGQNCEFNIEFHVRERDNCFVAMRVIADNRQPYVTLLHEDDDVKLADRFPEQ